MARFLVEVPHGEDEFHCARVIDIFLKTGSHFLTNADWGCRDGEHKAWFIAEVETRDEARNIVPPMLRSEAKIVELNGFETAEIEHILSQYAI